MPSTMRRVRCHRAVWPRVRFAGLVVALATAAAAQAAPITSRGSWWGTDGSNGSLQARDIGGDAVALNSPNASFFYETSTNLTWLADMSLTANSFAAAWRSGDVLNAVPEPQSLVLALTALAALGLGRRRKQDAQTAHG